MLLVFATRPSALARWQTTWVIEALQRAWPGLECRQEIITTQGDRVLDKPLPEIGGKGLFTNELESELISGRVDAAVHSLKDLPVENPAGLTIGAVPAREDGRDVLISQAGWTLETLPGGARVGTSSLRRAAQVLAARPDLKIEPLRGNVDTRLRKAQDGEYDAIVLAGAGVKRLGLEGAISQWLPYKVMLPAPGQGALAVQCRAGDKETLRILQTIEHASTRACVEAERGLLAGFGGGCSLPVGAYAEPFEGQIFLRAVAASPRGSRVFRGSSIGEHPWELGIDLANKLLSEGAGECLYA